MKIEELTAKIEDRIFDLRERGLQKVEQVAALATDTETFEVAQIKQLCDEIHIILNQVEILQEFVDPIEPDTSISD